MISVNNNLIVKNWAVLDGTASGWVLSYFDESILYLTYIDHLNQLDFSHNAIYFIDIPILLPTTIMEYPRRSDQIGKKLLGKYHSSIFYAPLSEWLSLNYKHINTICSKENKPKLSKQSFNIFKKIKEAQSVFNKNPRFFKEIHPELLIDYFVSNKLSKKTIDGQLQRIHTLNTQFNFEFTHKQIKDCLVTLKNTFPGSKINIDDIIDTLFVSTLLSKNQFLTNSTQNDIIIDENLLERFTLFN